MPSRIDLLRSELLALRYRRGDREAMGELADLWAGPLYYYIRRFVPGEDEALDVLQDVWVRVIRKFVRLRNPAAFPAWLFKVARSVAVSRIRRQYRQEAAERQAAGPPRAGPEDNALTTEFGVEAVHNALHKLSTPHRECLVLHFIEGFSLQDVGWIVGAPLGTVKSRMHHAKRALRCILEQEVRGDDESKRI